MKSSLNSILLTCLLSLFALNEQAEAQRWRRPPRSVPPRSELEPAGRNQRIEIPNQSQQPIQNLQSAQQPRQSPPVQYLQPIQPQSSHQYQPPSNHGDIQGGTVTTSQRLQLVPGDVILDINGERIGGQADVTSAIARSPQTMYLTVRDGRTGITALYVTTLNPNRPRFGVNHQTHPGGGSRVISINQNSPASRIFLVE